MSQVARMGSRLNERIRAKPIHVGQKRARQKLDNGLASVGRGSIIGSRLKAAVGPEMLFRRFAYAGLDRRVHAAGVLQLVPGRKIGERAIERNDIAASVRQLPGDAGNQEGVGELGEAPEGS